MRVFAFALLAIATVSGNEEKRLCEPGALTRVDCNECICSKDGKSQVCTMMLCERENSYDLRLRRQAPEENSHKDSSERICEPGAMEKVGCNHCICSQDGTRRACTLMLCLPEGFHDAAHHVGASGKAGLAAETSPEDSGQVLRSSLLRQRRQVSHNRPCEAGKQFKIYCNTCSCGSDGFSVACTRMECPEGVYNEDGSLKNPKRAVNKGFPIVRDDFGNNNRCEPGKQFKRYCNTCTCGFDGKPASCTLMGCPEGVYNKDGSLKHPELVSNNPLLRQRRQVSHNRPCEAGKRFKIYCNTCSCGSDGFSVSCTRMACPEGVYNEDGSLKNPKRALNKGFLRVRRQIGNNNRCEPGKQFKSYCNTCTCGSDGKTTACTLIGCPEGVYNEDGSLKHPELVSNNPLLRQQRQVSHNRRCEAGKQFKMYCNTCSCGSDGFSVSCTRMACPEGVFNEDGSLRSPGQVSNNPLLRQRRQVSPHKGCEPGKQFKVYCNSCSCLSDGLSMACTIMACPKGVYNEDGSLIESV